MQYCFKNNLSKRENEAFISYFVAILAAGDWLWNPESDNISPMVAENSKSAR